MADMEIDNSLSKIKELYQHSLKLSNDFKQLMSEIKPMEFESYAEYFLIHTFKKGISESGRVHINDVRKKEQQAHYEISSEVSERALRRGIRRRKLRSENSADEGSGDEELSQSLPSRSSSISDDNSSVVEVSSPSWDTPQGPLEMTGSQRGHADEKVEEKKVNAAPAVAAAATTTNTTTSALNIGESGVFKDTQGTSQDSKIHPTVSVRRSMRLSEKERLEKLRKQEELEREKERQRQKEEETLKRTSSLDIGKPRSKKAKKITKPPKNVEKSIEIKDLYETLVPKVKVPCRRSDWVLPPRLRFTPEKQMRTRPVFNTVKMYELVNTRSLRKILSRFEGGVAGVRKSDMENVK